MEDIRTGYYLCPLYIARLKGSNEDQQVTVIAIQENDHTFI